MNYFKEKKIENKETLLREEEKSSTSIIDAADYDIKFANKILNKPILTEADKYNVARVIEWFDYNLREINRHACDFEAATKRFLGDETYSDLTKAFISYKMGEFTERLKNE